MLTVKEINEHRESVLNFTKEANINFVPINSWWQHNNGNMYFVTSIANIESDRKDYPITINYIDVNGKLWCRPFSEWFRSFTCTEINSKKLKQYNYYKVILGEHPIYDTTGLFIIEDDTETFKSCDDVTTVDVINIVASNGYRCVNVAQYPNNNLNILFEKEI